MPTAAVCTTNNAHQTVQMNFFFTNTTLDTLGAILYYCFLFSMFIPGMYLMDRYVWSEEWWPKKDLLPNKKASDDVGGIQK
jgi:hypothetical protein